MSAVSVNVIHNPEKMFSSESLWVINSSDANKTRNRGNVIFTVNDSDGAEIPIAIPPTWIPFNLAMYTEVANFKKSTKFRETLRAGLIVVITQESADMLISQPTYEKEQEKVSELVAGMRNMAISSASASVGDSISIDVGVSSSSSVIGEGENSLIEGISEQETEIINAIAKEFSLLETFTTEQINKLCEAIVSLPDRKALTTLQTKLTPNSKAHVFIDKAIDNIDRKIKVELSELIKLDQHAYSN